MSDKKPFWVSWCDDGPGTWEWHGPWWTSGEDAEGRRTVCAAVLARDEDDAKARILAAHDAPPGELAWRFVDELPADWEPFCGRFRRKAWMQWPHGEGRTGAIEP